MAWSRNPILSAVRNEFPIGSHVLMAISGGVDSMTLLHAAIKIAKQRKLILGVAHIDHGVREDSHKDRELVSKVAKKNKIPIFIELLEKVPKGQNFEAWARQKRYKFLEKVRADNGYNWIATAHTADDVVETFLIRILSGKELGTIDRSDPKRHLIRPFLSIKKSSILKYANEEGVLWREDSTNSTDKYLRNRVRNKLIPLMSDLVDGEVTERVLIRSQSLAKDQEFLRDFAKGLYLEISKYKWGSREWIRALFAHLNNLHSSIAWRLSACALEEPLGYTVGEQHAERFTKFVLSNAAQVEMPQKIVIKRNKGSFFVSKKLVSS